MIRMIGRVPLLLALLAGCDSGSNPPPTAAQAPPGATPAAAAPPPAVQAATTAPGGPPATVLTSTLPPEVDSLPSETGGVCSFDTVAVEGERHHISGWAATARNGKPADKVFIRVSVQEGDRYALATPIQREDVAKALNNPALAGSGFDLWLPRDDVPKGARLTLYQVSDGRLRICGTGASA